MTVQDLGKSIEEYRAKLVIVDSIIALHGAEFTGRETLAERQQRPNMMLHRLSRDQPSSFLEVIEMNCKCGCPEIMVTAFVQGTIVFAGRIDLDLQ